MVVIAATEHLEPLPDVRDSMRRVVGLRGLVRWVGRIPVRHLVTSVDGMQETVDSGRVSETPDAPVELCCRDGVVGRYEIVDGHHRVAAILRAGGLEVEAIIYDYVDDEPYRGPFAVLGGEP